MKQINFNDPSIYKRTNKKKYTITAHMPVYGTQVFNKLERAKYMTTSEKQFVLTGTVGEQWVIDVNKLAMTYTFANGAPITKDALASMVTGEMKDGLTHPVIKPFKVISRPGPVIWAVRVPLNLVFQIPTSWGDMLTVNAPGVRHGNGDYLVCADMGGMPNLNDRWVVNGEVFPSTYNMKSFPNESTYKQRAGKV